MPGRPTIHGINETMPTNRPQKKRLLKEAGDLLLLGLTILVIYRLLAPIEQTSFHPVSMSDLQGVWTTTQPRYRDRFLQFSDGMITFGWGDAGEGSYAVDAIESAPVKNRTLVHIRYNDLDSTQYQLSFYYERRDGGIIAMKNQKGVYWYRTDTQPTHIPIFK